MNVQLLENLRKISSGRLMMEFTKYYHQNFVNVETPTLGGLTFWDTIYEVDGWKVQRHKLPGNLLAHYRILDPQNYRKGWSLTEDQFEDDVQHFVRELQVRGQNKNHQYGIVFSGGGAKGAYQIGVWKYLREQGLDRKISGVSGASVGALNSLLFAQEDFDKALEVWMSIRKEDLTKADPVKILRSLCEVLGGISSPFTSAVGALANLPKSHSAHEEWLGFFASQKRLHEIIDTFVDAEKVLHSTKLVYSSLCQIPSFQPYYVCWKLLHRFDDIRDLVLTSAAVPLIYPARYFDKRLCVDGGLVDNLPVAKLAGICDAVIVVHLSPEWDAWECRQWNHSFGKLQTSRARLYHIYPSTSQNMTGLASILEISPELTQWRMELGYQDAKKQLADLC